MRHEPGPPVPPAWQRAGGAGPTYEVRIWVEAHDGVGGAATPIVRGALAGDEVCLRQGSCLGRKEYPADPLFDDYVLSEGSGLALHTGFHQATALDIECDQRPA